MPIEIYERVNPTTSEDQSGASIRREYFLRGSIDEVEVHEAFVDYLPVTYANLWLVRASVEPQGGPIWHGSAEYGIPQTPPDATLGDPTDVNPGTGLPNNQPSTPGDNEMLGPEYSFSTTGKTEKLLLGKGEKLTMVIAGREVPTYTGLIGEKSDGAVEGVEIPATHLEFVTTRYVRVTPKYTQVLKDITSTINENEWLGFKPGELLFLGAEGSYRDPVKGWSVTYKFAVSRNLVGTGRAGDGMGGHHPHNPKDKGQDLLALGLVLGERVYDPPPSANFSIISTEVKRGWDYLYIGYDEGTDPKSKMLRGRPWLAQIVQVFEERDFRLLGLGG